MVATKKKEASDDDTNLGSLAGVSLYIRGRNSKDGERSSSRRSRHKSHSNRTSPTTHSIILPLILFIGVTLTIFHLQLYHTSNPDSTRRQLANSGSTSVSHRRIAKHTHERLKRLGETPGTDQFKQLKSNRVQSIEQRALTTQSIELQTFNDLKKAGFNPPPPGSEEFNVLLSLLNLGDSVKLPITTSTHRKEMLRINAAEEEGGGSRVRSYNRLEDYSEAAREGKGMRKVSGGKV